MAALMSTVGVSEPPELLQALTRTAVSWASDESADERVLYQAFEVAVHHFAKSLTANQQDLISHLKQQRKLLKLDPATKAPNPYPSDARQYREFHGNLSLWRAKQTLVAEESMKESSMKKEFYRKSKC